MNTERVDLQAFDYVLSKVTDGFLFERFAQLLLCHIVGIEFVPLGGVKDRGIDGLDHTWQLSTDERTIYQISIESDPRAKVLRTVKTLKRNGFKFSRLCYVTNRVVHDQDKLMEEVYSNEGVILQARDIAWLRGNIGKSEATLRVYADFVRDNAHNLPFQAPNIIVTDYTTDPRVFVFLRQQLDSKGEDKSLRELLLDSLILFGLEGTDPDKQILRSRAEIVAEIARTIKFPINHIEGHVDERLNVLSTRPRQINYHTKEDKYCLPYETRLRMDEQQLKDAALFEQFNQSTQVRLAKHLRLQNVQASRPDYLLSQTFNQIFKKQGLDFADFVLHQKDPKIVETALPEVVHSVMDAAGTPPTTRTQVGLALQGTIREIIYRGTPAEHEYLRKLSRTYMLLFLVQCDPHVCNYFDTLASKLTVFVCNSILVPALSEICIPHENRRFWNLLVQARNAGVKLFMNKVTLMELVSHIHTAIETYNQEYEGWEDYYSDDRTLRYVRPILIRAYMYQKAQGDAIKFGQFIDKFVSPRAKPAIMAQELITFFQGEFGIEYIDDAAIGITVEPAKFALLTDELEKMKRTKHQAENDARTILTIYGLREKNNESGKAGIFGFRTWWLSMDTTTHRAVKTCFHDDRMVSCYLRPDFLLNYIALAARGSSAAKVFDQMFPTLVGVSLSHHVTEELSNNVHQAIKAHSNLSPTRVKALLGSLSTQLMTDVTPIKGKQLRHFLDQAFVKESPERTRRHSITPPGKQKRGSATDGNK